MILCSKLLAAKVTGRRQQVLMPPFVSRHMFGINLLQANWANGDGRGDSDDHVWLHASWV